MLTSKMKKGPPIPRDAEQMAKMAAEACGAKADQALVLSTGVIGHRMPMQQLSEGIPQAAKGLGQGAEADLRAAHAIMTTDTRPKQLGWIAALLVYGLVWLPGIIRLFLWMSAVIGVAELINQPKAGSSTRLVSRLSFNAASAVGDKAKLKKSFPTARHASARSGNPSKPISTRLGKTNIQPGL